MVLYLKFNWLIKMQKFKHLLLDVYTLNRGGGVDKASVQYDLFENPIKSAKHMISFFKSIWKRFKMT